MGDVRPGTRPGDHWPKMADSFTNTYVLTWDASGNITETDPSTLGGTSGNNNELLTDDGAGGINSESGLTFDAATGVLAVSTYSGSPTTWEVDLTNGNAPNGFNSSISFGKRFGAPALVLYDNGAAARWGWGLKAGEMQFFSQTGTGNHFSWNIGGDLQVAGTNEMMRLEQDASGNGELALNAGGVEYIYNVGNHGDANYERLALGFDTNVAEIGTFKGGTGSARELSIQTDGTEAMRIDASQQVGIGISSGIDAPLHVEGNFSSPNSAVRIRSTATTGQARLDFNNDVAAGGASGASMFLCGSTFGGTFNNAFGVWNYLAGPIVFATSGTERMRVDSTGIDLSGGGILLAERADHAFTPAAGSGEIWIKSDTPNKLYFTDDAGTDHDLTAGGGSGAFTADGDTQITPSTAIVLDQATGNEIALDLSHTVNKATSGNTTGVLMNVTDTASPGDMTFFDAQVGGTSKVKLGSVDCDFFLDTNDSFNVTGTGSTTSPVGFHNPIGNGIISFGFESGAKIDFYQAGAQAILTGTWTFPANSLLPDQVFLGADSNGTDDVRLVVNKTGNGASQRILLYGQRYAANNDAPSLEISSNGVEIWVHDGSTWNEQNDTLGLTVEASTANVLIEQMAVITEQSDHTHTPAAGSLGLWVKDDAPNKIVATDDAGTDWYLQDREVQLEAFAYGTTNSTGDGAAYFRVGSDLAGRNLIDVGAQVGSTQSSSGTIDVQIARMRAATAGGARTVVDMLSTKCTIDANEWDSKDATAAMVVNASNDDVQEGDLLRVDVDAVGTGSVGLFVTLQFR